MEIKDILSKLGLDLSNPDAKRGALEAIDAILASRTPDMNGLGGGAGSGGGSNETEVELDPDLIQPSIKQSPTSDDMGDDDIEIEDEEDILSQIKHKDSEDPIENNNSSGNSSQSDKESNSTKDNNTSDSKSDSNQTPTDPDDAQDNDSDDKSNSSGTSKNPSDDSDDDEIFGDSDDDIDSDSDTFDGDGDISDSDEDGDESGVDTDSDEFGDIDGDGDGGDAGDDIDGNGFDFDDSAESDIDGDLANDFDDDEQDDDESDGDGDGDDDFDFDEDDFIDDELNDSAEDEAEKTKQNARKIKRERTLAAAKKALVDAQAKKVSPALIRELEKSIEALEALTEAVNKSLKDISDAEFNRLINRVLDAIDACGNSGLTYSSEEERAAKVQEIKTDLSKAETQNDLSAEDVAKIRAETQAIKAREKEAAKYAPRDRQSFSGFKEFLASISKAITRQVSNTQTKNDTWSAINRKYSGTGVLRPGKQVKELPNTKIPVIDFYFDCSSSWNSNDIAVGKKAVAALADLEAKGQIKINIFYFADEVSTVYNDVAGGWTSAWNHIVKNIIATQATNVVIMTDSDMEQQGENGAGARGFLKYSVPGRVWYLWKNGRNAQRLPRDLTGRKGVQQFSFSASDV